MRLRKKLLTLVMVFAMVITTMPLQAMAGEAGTAVPEKVLSAQWNETYDVFYHAAGESYNSAIFTSEDVLSVGGSSYNIKNKPTAITTVVDGSTVTISFTNLTRPIGQISDEWNSTEQGEVYIKYNSDIPEKSVVYSGNSNLQTLVLTDVPEGTYSLTNGAIFERANESSLGTDLGNGIVKERSFGSLPNITVTVAKETSNDESETDKEKDKDVTKKENLVSNTKAPLKTLGASLGKVKVVVENTTFPKANGAAWDGQLVDKWVDIYPESTMASCFLEALNQTNSGYTQSGAESNYIGSIHGLGAFDGGSASGWMVTLNDWFINEGIGGITVENGNLQDGDLIRIMYTSNGYGADLGSSWDNNEKTLADLESNIGSLTPEFNKDTHEYELVVPSGTEKVKITPTATNKNFLVKSFVGDKEYKRTQEIPVVDGMKIKVICGDPAWPSMNGGSYGGADSVPAETYTITVVTNHTPTIKSGVENNAVIKILKGTKYKVDLLDIFEDVEDEELTYKVSVDSGEYILADSKYLYDVDAFVDVDFRFIANDGTENSPVYHVTLRPVSEVDVSKLESLLVHRSYNPNDDNVLLKNDSDSYTTTNVFNSSTLEYDLGVIGDNDSSLRLRAKPEEKGATVTLKCNGEEKDVTYSSGDSKWASCLKAGKNVAELVVTPAKGSDKLPRTYKLIIVCEPSLKDLTVDAGKPVYWDKAFKTNDKEYTITLDEDVSILNFDATPRHKECIVEYNGGDNVLNASSIGKVDVKVLVGEGEDLVTNTYVVNLNKVPSFTCNFNVNIKDAVISVFDPEGASVNPNKDSIYTGLFSDMTYTYVVSKHGYISATGEIPAGGGEIIATLEKAATGLPEVDSQWKNFRGDDSNMAIVDVKTPIDKEKTALLWNKKLGSGWSASPSIHIIVDNALIVLSGKKIYKLDLETGDVLQEGDLVASPAFGYTPSVYAEGMIFVPLADSTIQAFNAKTLESLWVYKDPIKGGQSLSPITYSDGYIYTGFWVRPGADANHVCLSVTDEDPTRTDEIKAPTWRRTQKGGFYWAGSVNIGEFNIVGGDGDGPDDGEFDNVVTSMNSKTGEVVSQLNISGAQRSSIAYDKGKGKIYFTTKVGNLYSADINAKTGVLSNLIGKKLPGSKQSTSTPVVYKNRVYIGLGAGFGNPSKIVTLDATTLDELYSLEVKGYPQCSVLLSTAYEEETGYIYLYTTYNAKPGGIQMIKTKANATSADDAEVIDIYDAKGFENYCIASII
ncbi:MAG: PQQ-binding-like beta-propeller repeat protein, partial [Clostridiales bacterium]|nr:PQQ-binding-like beta-propeller repeat protein [Clostridiales bacterium]